MLRLRKLCDVEAYDAGFFYEYGVSIELPTTQYYRLYVELKDQQKNVIDYFITPKIAYLAYGGTPKGEHTGASELGNYRRL